MSSLRLHPAHGGLAVFAIVAACGVVPPALPETAPQQPAQSRAVAPATAPAPASAAVPKPSAKVDAKGSPSAKVEAKALPSAASSARPTVAAAPAPAPSPLDLKSLEQKLKDTKAIGLMTKLAVKNQVDDLVTQFRAFHEGRRPPTLAELRRPYELLLMKLLSLLQDQDAGLAKALHDSREALWGVLSDRSKFAQHS